MIEEEDDEEILKKGVTLKTFFKNLLLILLIIAGALFIFLDFGLDQFSRWSIGFMLICLGSTLMQMQKGPPEPLRQTLTILTCNLCGLTKVRNYAKGDFVFKMKDKCDKCVDLMEIKQIYSVRLKKTSEPSKKASIKK